MANVGRPKAKVKRVNVKITLDPEVYELARESINNLSRFVEVCLIKHIRSQKKNGCDNIYYAKLYDPRDAQSLTLTPEDYESLDELLSGL